MKRVLFFGDTDWTWTRPVNRVFLDLRPETHIVCCIRESGAGRIALRTAEAARFQTLTNPWPDDDENEWDDAYWFSNSLDETAAMLQHALVFARRTHVFLSRRPDPRPVEEARSASPD